MKKVPLAARFCIHTRRVGIYLWINKIHLNVIDNDISWEKVKIMLSVIGYRDMK